MRKNVSSSGPKRGAAMSPPQFQSALAVSVTGHQCAGPRAAAETQHYTAIERTCTSRSKKHSHDSLTFYRTIFTVNPDPDVCRAKMTYDAN